VRPALLDSMPRVGRLRLQAELRDLRLARVGIEGGYTRDTLQSLGILTGGGLRLRRGPDVWGEATRVHVR
jgi:hypothetical protein